MLGRRGAAVVVALGMLLVTGCGDRAQGDGTRSVVAAFYPLYEAAVRVGGQRVRVSNLTPAGAEPHDLELSPRQVEAVLDADVVLVMGAGFQPTVEQAAARRQGGSVRLLDVLPVPKDARDEVPDPHVWLDPVLMSDVVGRVADALASADPQGRPTYEANAQAYRHQLASLDTSFRTGLASCRRRLIVTAHDAFGYLARRYGLEQRAITGISPDAEPDPRRLAELAVLVRRDGVTTVFTETLVSPRVAQALAREAGVTTAVLDPIEGLTADEAAKGETYVSLMERNLIVLRGALGCR